MTPNTVQNGRSWRRALALLAASTLFLSACGSDALELATQTTVTTAGASGGSSAPAESKLVILAMPFPCGLNQITKDLCAGAQEAAKELPPGYELQIKTGVNYDDTQAFNSLLQTTLELDPDGMVVYPNGVAAQTPVLKQACDQGVKIVFLDSQAQDVPCEVSFSTVDSYAQGKLNAEWLIAHPPTPNSKKVAVVQQQPGKFESNDLRVKGFVETMEEAGYELVGNVVSTNSVDQTRSLVQNLATANPDLAAIFSANSFLGNGTTQGLKGNSTIIQLTIGGVLEDLAFIEDGTVSANAAADNFDEGKAAVKLLVDALEGKEVPEEYVAATLLITKENVEEHLARLDN